MPQYVMCKKHSCPKTKECYRYSAVPDKDQFYNNFSLLCDEKDNYCLFMKIRPNDNIVKSDTKTEIKSTEQGDTNAK